MFTQTRKCTLRESVDLSVIDVRITNDHYLNSKIISIAKECSDGAVSHIVFEYLDGDQNE